MLQQLHGMRNLFARKMNLLKMMKRKLLKKIFIHLISKELMKRFIVIRSQAFMILQEKHIINKSKMGWNNLSMFINNHIKLNHRKIKTINRNLGSIDFLRKLKIKIHIKIIHNINHTIKILILIATPLQQLNQQWG